MMITMIRPHTVVLIGTVSLGLGWVAGNISSPAAQDSTSQRRSTGPRPLGSPATTVAPYTAQLRQKLDEHPRTPVPGRNPFAFGSRRAYSPAPISRAESAVEPESRPAPAPPPLFAFKLSGIAASEKDGVVVLTAIVIDNGSMVFVKTGEKLSGGHSVLRIDEKSIVIVDAAGVEQILRLP